VRYLFNHHLLPILSPPDYHRYGTEKGYYDSRRHEDIPPPLGLSDIENIVHLDPATYAEGDGDVSLMCVLGKQSISRKLLQGAVVIGGMASLLARS
jgi:hypothetical protein